MRTIQKLTRWAAILAYAAAADERGSSTASSGRAAPKVAVVGGGAAGILSARELQKLNYDVTVYEASYRVGGLSTTIEDDGIHYDLATVFMSSGDFKTKGLTAELQELLREAELIDAIEHFQGETQQLVKTDRTINRNYFFKKNMDIEVKGGTIIRNYFAKEDEEIELFVPPTIMDAIDRGDGQDVLDELINGLRVLESIVMADTQGVAAVDSPSIDVRRDETFDEWAERVQAGYIRDVLAVLTDALMGGPSRNASAIYILNQRARIGPSALATIVQGVALKMLMRFHLPRGLSRIPASFRPLIFRGRVREWIGFDNKHGFEGFWHDLVKARELDIRLNTPVTHLVVDGKSAVGVGVSDSDEPVFYDAVILATPAYATAEILRQSTGLSDEMTKLASEFGEVPRDHGTVSVAYKARDGAGVFPAGIGGIITSLEPDFKVPMSIAKQYADGDVQIVGFYADSKCEDANLTEYEQIAKDSLKEHLSLYDYEISGIVHSACFDTWPYRASNEQVEDGFLQRIEASQGDGGIYFSGELLTGAGIPSLAQYAQYSIAKHFPGFFPIKEIEYVKIFGADVKKNPLWRHPEELFVEFSHRGKVRGRSVPLDNFLEPSWANVPLLLTKEAMLEPLKCEIKRRRNWLHWIPGAAVTTETTVATAYVVLKDEVKATSVIRDAKGRDTGDRMKLHYFLNEWVAAKFDAVNPRPNIDLYWTLFVSMLEDTILDLQIGGTEVLSKPVQAADPRLKTLTVLGGRVEYPAKDEFVKTIFQIKVAQPFVNRFLPFTRRNNPVGDRAALRNEIRVAKLGDNLVEPREGRWVAPLSDASMHRFFFSSLGMFLITKGGNSGYVADMTPWMSGLAYREDFDNLGCKVFFDGGAQITKIEDYDGAVYRPGDRRWEWAKLKARSSAFVLVSLQHLMQYHLSWANIPGMAMRKFLSPSHQFRMALTPHFFKTHDAAYQAKDLLVAKRGPLGRLLPFEYEDGYVRVLNHLLDDFNFTTYPDELERHGMMGNEFHVGASDGLALRQVLMDYVSNLFDEIYPSESSFRTDNEMRQVHRYLAERIDNFPSEYTMENLKLAWGEILFRVTGGHWAIGNTAICALEPFFVNFRIKTKDKGVLVGNREVIAGVVVITGLTLLGEYPKLSGNLTHVLHDPKSKAYQQLHADFTQLGNEIDERNKQRRFVNRDFHPETVALSTFS